MTKGNTNHSSAVFLAAEVLILLVVVLAATAPHGADSSHTPKGAYALKSAGRCGPFSGSEGVEASKEQLSASESSFDVVTCEKHLKEHTTQLVHAHIGGANVKFPVFASRDDKPESSADLDRSFSSKSSSDSSPAQSSSSDSVAPVTTTISAIVQLAPVGVNTRRRRRHRALLGAFITFVPGTQDVADINTWLSEFAIQNRDLLPEGRDSVTAGSFRKDSNGVIFFSLYITTTSPDAVLSRVVELRAFTSLNERFGIAIISDGRECDRAAQIDFAAEERLTAQLSAAPPPGCSNPLETASPVLDVPAPDGAVVNNNCPSDKQILIDFGGLLSRTPVNWTSSNPICIFEGVTCDVNGDYPVTLNLAASSYAGGPIPASLSCLTGLTELSLTENSFTGTLPPQWSALTNLLTLEVNENSLTGTIPPEWSNLVDIENLYMNDNGLTGSLPPEWSALTSVTLIYILDNGITGPLPPAWSALPSIEVILANENGITGTLPPAWSALSTIVWIDLGKNSLSGVLPSEWQALTTIEKLELNGNSLTGNPPASWSELASISLLSLSSTNLSPSLPPAWTELGDTLDAFSLIMTNIPGLALGGQPTEWDQAPMAGKFLLDTP